MEDGGRGTGERAALYYVYTILNFLMVTRIGLELG